jgi:hypothetical protein
VNFSDPLNQIHFWYKLKSKTFKTSFPLSSKYSKYVTTCNFHPYIYVKSPCNHLKTYNQIINLDMDLNSEFKDHTGTIEDKTPEGKCFIHPFDSPLILTNIIRKYL